MIKLIVSDLDGTLLNKAHLVDEISANAIKYAQAEGYEFMVATGRHDGSVLPMFKEYGIECNYILLNGALYKDSHGNVIKEIPLDIKKASAIMHYLEEEGIRAHLYTKDGIAAMHPEDILTDFIEHLKGENISDEEIAEILEKSNFGTMDITIDSLDDYFDKSPVVYKIEAFSKDEGLLQKIRTKLQKMEGIAISSSIGNNFELTDIRAQKGILLEELLPMLGYAKDEVLVFGDSLNDLTMMERFPYAVAMENACSEILEAASYTIGNYKDHAVAKAIYTVIEMQK